MIRVEPGKEYITWAERNTCNHVYSLSVAEYRQYRNVFVALFMVCIVLMLGGCSRAEGFQDVENITAVNFLCGPIEDDSNTRYDLDNGVVYYGDSKESELDPSEIESIRNAIAVAEKWDNHYHYEPFSIGMTGPFIYKIVIEYCDGTSCEFEGYTLASSMNSAKWPKGFDELKSTLDGIIHLRDYGSFTTDYKTYSYDGKYYACIIDRPGFEIDIYSDNYICAINRPCEENVFHGICWENDSYNLWIQTKNGDTMCFSPVDGEWILNEDAIKPDYIITKGVV